MQMFMLFFRTYMPINQEHLLKLASLINKLEGVHIHTYASICIYAYIHTNQSRALTEACIADRLIPELHVCIHIYIHTQHVRALTEACIADKYSRVYMYIYIYTYTHNIYTYTHNT